MTFCALCHGTGILLVDNQPSLCMCPNAIPRRIQNNRSAIDAYRKGRMEPVATNLNSASHWGAENECGDLPKCKPLYLCGHGCGSVVRAQDTSCSRCAEEIRALRENEQAKAARKREPALGYAFAVGFGTCALVALVIWIKVYG